MRYTKCSAQCNYWDSIMWTDHVREGVCVCVRIHTHTHTQARWSCRQKAWVCCGRSFVRIAGSNPARCNDAFVWYLMCIVRQRSLRRADHPSIGVLPSVVCLSVIVKRREWGSPDQLGAAALSQKKKYIYIYIYTHTHTHTYIYIYISV